ncbi:MAG: hypothetical protein ACK5PP_15650 [Acidimicrobiales bacterium]
MTKTATSGLVDGHVEAGSQVTYTITATDHGPSDAADAWILDRIPVDSGNAPLATYVSSSIDGPVGTCEFVTVYDDTSDAPSSVITDQYYLCTHGTLAVGDTMTMTFTIDVNDDASGELPNWAWGGAQNNTEHHLGAPEGVENSPYATLSAAIDEPADLALEIDAPTDAIPGTTLDVSVTLDNAGPSGISQPWVEIMLPAGAVYDSVTGATCVPVSGGVRCTTDPLASGARLPFTLHLTADPALAGSSSVTGLAGGAGADPDLTNNTAADTVAWTPVAALEITKTAHTRPGGPGR